MVAQPLTASIKALSRILARLNVIEGKVITDLSPDCITLLKQQDMTLSESHGMDARFLALAVLNRLAQPRQITRFSALCQARRATRGSWRALRPSMGRHRSAST
jgi:hypothetical protein